MVISSRPPAASTPLAICVAAVFAGLSPAHAFTEDSLDCLGRAGNAKARLACAEAELAAQNKMLAASVQRLRGTVDQRGQELLQRAQQSWDAYREAHCTWMVDRLRKDPEAQRIERILCLATTAETRSQEIDDYQASP
jgi:uncharacterized protein YecT (DUF1311 family)